MKRLLEASEAAVRQLTARLAATKQNVPGMLPELLVIPYDRVVTRVAKYDVVLRETQLRAVQAQQTILTRMVRFVCNHCRERFPAFHPAYEPPPHLNMQLLGGGRKGSLARCNILVASWDTPPEFPRSGRDGDGNDIAATHTGVCLACKSGH